MCSMCCRVRSVENQKWASTRGLKKRQLWQRPEKGQTRLLNHRSSTTNSKATGQLRYTPSRTPHRSSVAGRVLVEVEARERVRLQPRPSRRRASSLGAVTRRWAARRSPLVRRDRRRDLLPCPYGAGATAGRQGSVGPAVM